MEAFSQALALESASDSKYENGEYKFNADELTKYAEIVAYKVYFNLKNGFNMDEEKNPLIFN